MRSPAPVPLSVTLVLLNHYCTQTPSRSNAHCLSLASSGSPFRRVRFLFSAAFLIVANTCWWNTSQPQIVVRAWLAVLTAPRLSSTGHNCGLSRGRSRSVSSKHFVFQVCGFKDFLDVTVMSQVLNGSWIHQFSLIQFCCMGRTQGTRSTASTHGHHFTTQRELSHTHCFPTGDRTHTSCSGRKYRVLTTGPPGKSKKCMWYIFFPFWSFKNLLINEFLSALALCYSRAFSSCSEQGPLLTAEEL